MVDPLRIKHGSRGMIAEVVEDRGTISVHRGRLYAVRLRLDPRNESTTERSEDSPPSSHSNRTHGDAIDPSRFFR
jgi:hypothetical protein